MLRLGFLAGAAAALALVLGPAAAMAQTFDVKQPEVAAGVLELGLDNTFHAGLPRWRGSDVNRHVHEQSLDWGAAEWLKLSAVLKLEKPQDDAFRANNVALEAIVVFKPLSEKKERDVALGWFTGIDISTHPDTTNAVLFGPILAAKAGKLSVTANPFLERTFGRNSEEGIALNYAWQVKHELRDGLAIGIEGFGVIDNLGNAPPWAEQEHRIGPTLFTEIEVASGVKIAPDIGLLFGLTRATPDVAVKLNVGIPLYRKAAAKGD